MLAVVMRRRAQGETIPAAAASSPDVEMKEPTDLRSKWRTRAATPRTGAPEHLGRQTLLGMEPRFWSSGALLKVDASPSRAGPGCRP